MSLKSKRESLYYRAGKGTQEIVLHPDVLQHFLKNRQTSKTAAEVGGQLFAEFSPGAVCIGVATGPVEEDKRGRFWFSPNETKQNAEIQKLFKERLHFVGDWHTHPEQIPSPSGTDIKSMKDCFIKSRHQLQSFVMVIVGQADFPTGLWVSLHNKTGYHSFSPFEKGVILSTTNPQKCPDSAF